MRRCLKELFNLDLRKFSPITGDQNGRINAIQLDDQGNPLLTADVHGVAFVGLDIEFDTLSIGDRELELVNFAGADSLRNASRINSLALKLGVGGFRRKRGSADRKCRFRSWHSG